MKNETTIIIIFLLVISISGCLDSNPQNNLISLKDNSSSTSITPSTTQSQADSTRSVSPVQTPSSSILQPTTEYSGSVNSPVGENETVEGTWIRIDPIHDYYSGEKFFINGSTNLPEVSQINIEGSIDCYGCCPKAGCSGRGEFAGIAKNENSGKNSRNWSFMVNTFDFPPQLYLVYAFNNETRSMATSFRILERKA